MESTTASTQVVTNVVRWVSQQELHTYMGLLYMHALTYACMHITHNTHMCMQITHIHFHTHAHKYTHTRTTHTRTHAHTHTQPIAHTEDNL